MKREIDTSGWQFDSFCHRRITTMSLRIVRNIDVQTKIKIITNVIPNLCYLSFIIILYIREVSAS